MQASERDGDLPPGEAPGSISRWLAQLKAGDPAAAQPLWERYFHRLVTLARRKLRGPLRKAADEEDVALSAFNSVCRGAADGRFPRLNDSHDLWQLLVLLTDRKALNLSRRERRVKRGGGRVLDEAALPRKEGSDARSPLDRQTGREPSPEFAAQVAEECRRLLSLLGDPELCSIALWKMEGDSIEQIAARLGCVPRTVDRRLRLIRDTWQREVRHA
jgi:DNA-directed RNA polymerase specialized sigma24 family protein